MRRWFGYVKQMMMKEKILQKIFVKKQSVLGEDPPEGMCEDTVAFGISFSLVSLLGTKHKTSSA